MYFHYWESLSEAFLFQLRSCSINIDKCAGQDYDGASNMSGKFRGVQAKLRAICPQALYVQCRAYCLNLVIYHASEEPIVKNMMKIIQEIAFCFNYSTKRLLQFP